MTDKVQQSDGKLNNTIIFWSLPGNKSRFGIFKNNGTPKALILKLLMISGIEENPGPEHDHLENRKKCCAICFLKADREISSTQENCIKEQISSDYDSSNPRLPSGICFDCRSKLNSNPLKLKVPDYNKNCPDNHLKWSRSNEAASKSCSCLMCRVVMSNGGGYKKVDYMVIHLGHRQLLKLK